MRATAIFFAAILCLPATQVGAQTSDAESEVLETVQRFFDALSTKDGATLRNVLTPQGYFHALQVSDDSTSVFPRPYDSAITSITGSDAAFTERMFDPVVHVHRSIAVVWTPYDFHINGNFSHCGIDVFNLIRIGGAWQISSVAYTVEQNECPDRPPLVGSD